MQTKITRLVRQRCGWAALVALVTAPACKVSQDREVAIGKENAAEVESQVPLLGDTAVDRFVTALGMSMASRTSRADLEWHFTVVNAPEVNAFALPGGYVYVNRGAIEQADRLDELAGIMGHEIGHVVRRHGVDQMEKQERGKVGLILLCTLTSACRTIGGQIAVDVGAKALAAQYSQKDESQADSEGVLNTMRAGIDPEGLPAFFQKMLDEEKVHPGALEAFFSTHPTDQARVARTREQIAHLDPPPSPSLLKDNPEFHAIQEHVRGLPAPPKPTMPQAHP